MEETWMGRKMQHAAMLARSIRPDDNKVEHRESGSSSQASSGKE
jgi:hypothetical protein